MKRLRSRVAGYTLIEVLIFLGVSGALMVSALALVGGQQNKTEFTQSVREFESRILDVINDVSTGFYPSADNVKCDATLPIGSGITLSSGSVEQGQNSGCIFIGRVIQFTPNNGSALNTMRVYSVAGQRLQNSGVAGIRQITSLELAKGQLIAKGDTTGTTAPDLFEDIDLGPLRVEKVCYNTCGPAEETGGVGFFTTFSSYTVPSSPSALQSGSTSADLVPIPNSASTGLNQTGGDFVDKLNAVLSTSAINSVKNPSGGFTICATSDVTDQYTLIRIGGNARNLTTQFTIHNGSTCP